MVKSPEDYFREQDFSMGEAQAEAGFTASERAFMQKYMGVDESDILHEAGVEPATSTAAFDDGEEQTLDALLKTESELQMVAFFLGEQEYTVPAEAVQEVIRHQTPTRLPAAPPYLAGIINLRGRITPLVRLRHLLDIPARANAEDGFIVVCQRRGLQVGFMIERVHTMYRVSQCDIDWAVESHLGTNTDFVSGLLKSGDRLVGIISVERIIEGVLKR